MNDRQQDPELRSRFAELRRQDATQAPPFAELIARAHTEAAHNRAGIRTERRTPRLLWRLGWAGGLAAAAALVLLLANPRGRASQAAFEKAVQAFQTDPALGAWRSPTDALLDVPGRRLISTIPSIGVEGAAIVPRGSR